MARHNITFLYGRVSKQPKINKQDEVYTYGMCYVHVVRGLRDAHDELKYLKHDKVLIMSKEKDILEKMETWQENSIVLIKGVIVSKNIPKNSTCSFCAKQDVVTKNIVQGTLLYINPIYVQKIKDCQDKTEALEHIIENREISNQTYIMGTLCREPKQFITKRGVIITQYQIAINRKFMIRTDDPEIKTDWPWVKSYGEQAVEDRMRLRKSSDVVIDGFIQARVVYRKTKCRLCEKIYQWKDSAMEIVPYEVEYIRGTYKTDDDIEQESKHKVEEIRKMLYDNMVGDEMEDDFNTSEIVDDEDE